MRTVLLAGFDRPFWKEKKIKKPQEPNVLETSKTNPRYHSTCENTISPPLRSPTTSMHWRSIHGKRLLGDWPLGFPAQKGWEFHSPLSGSHHPRLSGKFVADSVFIDAFENCLLNLSILYHCEAAVSIQWAHKKQPRMISYFPHHAQSCASKGQIHSFLLSNVRHSCNQAISSAEKYILVFGMRTKVLDRQIR